MVGIKVYRGWHFFLYTSWNSPTILNFALPPSLFHGSPNSFEQILRRDPLHIDSRPYLQCRLYMAATPSPVVCSTGLFLRPCNSPSLSLRPETRFRCVSYGLVFRFGYIPYQDSKKLSPQSEIINAKDPSQPNMSTSR